MTSSSTVIKFLMTTIDSMLSGLFRVTRIIRATTFGNRCYNLGYVAIESRSIFVHVWPEFSEQ